MKKFKITYSIDKTTTYETIIESENREDALNKVDTKSHTNSKLIEECRIVSFDNVVELEDDYEITI